MKLSKNSLTALFIFFLAMIPRAVNLTGVSPLDWDQVRDIEAVEKIVYEHRPVLSGPVAGGEGGFLLGPLYFYVLVPFFVILGGSPISLPLTSIVLDSLAASIMYLLFTKLYSRKVGIFTSTIWALSISAIKASQISWNVSLLPIWFLASVYLISKFKTTPSGKNLALLMALFGISFHIHVTAIPIIPVWLILNFKLLKKITFKHVVFAKVPFIAFLSPLILFDLRHDFINLKLFSKFLTSSEPAIPVDYRYFASELFLKLSKLFSGYLFGQPYALLGIGLILLYFYGLSKNKFYLGREFLTASLLTITIVLLSKNPNFPEYYLSILLIPLVLVFADFIVNKIKNNSSFLLVMTCIIFLNLSKYIFSDKPFGLKNQILAVNRIQEFSESVDLRMNLTPGRGEGLLYNLNRSGLTIEEDSAHKIVVTESPIDAGEVSGTEFVFTESFGGYKLTGFIVK